MYKSIMTTNNSISNDVRVQIAAEAIRAHPMLQSLTTTAREKVMSNTVPVKKLEGEYVCKQGALSNGFYIVTEGVCGISVSKAHDELDHDKPAALSSNSSHPSTSKLSRHASFAHATSTKVVETILDRRLYPGDVFGENCMHSRNDEARCNANIFAVEPVWLMMIDRKTMLSVRNAKIKDAMKSLQSRYEQNVANGSRVAQIADSVHNQKRVVAMNSQYRRISGYDWAGRIHAPRINNVAKRMARFMSESLFVTAYSRLYRDVMLDVSKCDVYGAHTITLFGMPPGCSHAAAALPSDVLKMTSTFAVYNPLDSSTAALKPKGNFNDDKGESEGGSANTLADAPISVAAEALDCPSPMRVLSRQPSRKSMDIGPGKSPAMLSRSASRRDMHGGLSRMSSRIDLARTVSRTHSAHMRELTEHELDPAHEHHTEIGVPKAVDVDVEVDIDEVKSPAGLAVDTNSFGFDRRSIVADMQSMVMSILMDIQPAARSIDDIRLLFGIMCQRSYVRDYLCNFAMNAAYIPQDRQHGRRHWTIPQYMELCKHLGGAQFYPMQTVFDWHAAGTCAFVILRGAVRIFTEEIDIKSGRRSIIFLKDLAPGDLFGETALESMKYRTTAAVAITHCDLAVIEAADYRRALQCNGTEVLETSTDEKLRFLEHIHLLRNLTAQHKLTIARLLTHQVFTRGFKVVKKGEQMKSLCFIKEGVVSIIGKKKINLEKSSHCAAKNMNGDSCTFIKEAPSVITTLQQYSYYGETGILTKWHESGVSKKRGSAVSAASSLPGLVEHFDAVAHTSLEVLELSEDHFNLLPENVLFALEQGYRESIGWRNIRKTKFHEERMNTVSFQKIIAADKDKEVMVSQLGGVNKADVTLTRIMRDSGSHESIIESVASPPPSRPLSACLPILQTTGVGLGGPMAGSSSVGTCNYNDLSLIYNDDETIASSASLLVNPNPNPMPVIGTTNNILFEQLTAEEEQTLTDAYREFPSLEPDDATRAGNAGHLDDCSMLTDNVSHETSWARSTSCKPATATVAAASAAGHTQPPQSPAKPVMVDNRNQSPTPILHSDLVISGRAVDRAGPSSSSSAFSSNGNSNGNSTGIGTGVETVGKQSSKESSKPSVLRLTEQNLELLEVQSRELDDMSISDSITTTASPPKANRKHFGSDMSDLDVDGTAFPVGKDALGDIEEEPVVLEDREPPVPAVRNMAVELSDEASDGDANSDTDSALLNQPSMSVITNANDSMVTGHTWESGATGAKMLKFKRLLPGVRDGGVLRSNPSFDFEDCKVLMGHQRMLQTANMSTLLSTTPLVKCDTSSEQHVPVLESSGYLNMGSIVSTATANMLPTGRSRSNSDPRMAANQPQGSLQRPGTTGGWPGGSVGGLDQRPGTSSGMSIHSGNGSTSLPSSIQPNGYKRGAYLEAAAKTRDAESYKKVQNIPQAMTSMFNPLIMQATCKTELERRKLTQTLKKSNPNGKQNVPVNSAFMKQYKKQQQAADLLEKKRKDELRKAQKRQKSESNGNLFSTLSRQGSFHVVPWAGSGGDNFLNEFKREPPGFNSRANGTIDSTIDEYVRSRSASPEHSVVGMLPTIRLPGGGAVGVDMDDSRERKPSYAFTDSSVSQCQNQRRLSDDIGAYLDDRMTFDGSGFESARSQYSTGSTGLRGGLARSTSDKSLEAAAADDIDDDVEGGTGVPQRPFTTGNV